MKISSIRNPFRFGLNEQHMTTSLFNRGMAVAIMGNYFRRAKNSAIATKDGVVTAGVAAGRIVKRGAIATKDGVVTAGSATGRITLGAVHSVASAVAEKTKR